MSSRNSTYRICALIPTYNNAGTILDVVRRTHSQLDDIIVVADGCTDNTLELLGTLDFPIEVVSYPKNKGKGGALAAGFRRAISLGFDYVLTIDADGQHYPEDIPLLLRALDVHPGAMIIGSRRFTDDNMPDKNKFANKFSNFWFRLQTTIDLLDTQTGMRIYPLNKLHGLRLLTSRYEAELELLVFAAWHNVQLVPVPVRVYYPPKEQRVSYFRPVYDFTRISILNCFLCIGALLFGYVNMYWRTVLCFTYFGLTMLLLVSPFSILYFAICGNDVGSRARYHRIMQCLAKHYCFMLSGLHYTIHNPHHIQLCEHPSVIISNHQSFIDIMFYLSLSPRIAVMVKDYVWKNPIFYVVARKMDCFPVSQAEENREMLLRRVIEEGYSLLIFPEGTRTATGEIGTFHRGACYYAELFKLPIQPLLLEGMNDYISRRQFALKPNHVHMTILPEIPYKDLSFGRDYKRRTKSLELHYSALLHSNRIDKTIEGTDIEHLNQGAELAEQGYRVTLHGQLPTDDESISTAMRITRHGGRILRMLLLVCMLLLNHSLPLMAKQQRLTPYLADSTTNTGVAVIVCPGGSYSWLDMPTEGVGVAEWLQKNGINAFVLKYHVATVAAYIVGFRVLGIGNKYPKMLTDVEEALQQVYQMADSLHIDTTRIGVMGFSAGGHLTMMSYTHNRTEYKPHFLCPIYPVVTFSDQHYVHQRSRRGALGVWGQWNESMRDSLSIERHITPDCPPVFLVNCVDDPVVMYRNSELLDSALSANQVPHQYIQYKTGGHGFGASETKGTEECRQWKKEFLQWISNLNQ